VAPAAPAAPTAASGFAPPLLPYRDDFPIPDGYRLDEGPSSGLMTAGGLVLGLGYTIAFGISASHGFDRANGWLVVPVLGPWVALTKRESPCDIGDVEIREDAENCVENALDEAALIAAIAVDGLVQATGAGLFLGGVLSRRRELVREDLQSFRIHPWRAGRLGYGLGVSGRF